jgi:hypothetical protein
MGSGARTEFGAEFGARVLPRIILNELSNPDTESLEARINEAFEIEFKQIVRIMSSVPIHTGVKSGQNSLTYQFPDYFFFTILAFVMNKDRLMVMAAGDGIYYINGQRYEIGPFPGNCPPYFAYRLLEDFDKHDHRIKIVEDMPSSQVDSLLVASDGLSYYEQVATGDYLMACGKPVAPVEALYSDKSILGNTDGIQRILRLTQRLAERKDPETGLAKRFGRYLEDDTTIIAMKRWEDD